MLVMVKSHWPTFEIGKGSSVLQGPALWMTSGGKPRSGGTSMTGQGTFAVTVKFVTGVSGSSLKIRRLHAFGPQEVGVRRMVRFRHESGLTTAGNGLLINANSEQGR